MQSIVILLLTLAGMPARAEATDPSRQPPLIAAPGDMVRNPSLPGSRTPATTVPGRDPRERELPSPLPLPSAVTGDPARPLPPSPTAAPDLRLPPIY